ncbi:MAG: hypothetical protein AB1758_17985 [Candidatus Eremiobacterota bacterium]
MRRGLTLLEVVLSMWLLILALVLATAVLHRAMREMTRQEHATRAAFLAQDRLEGFVALPSRRLQPSSGSFEPPYQGYRWTLEVQELSYGLLYLQVTVDGPAGARFRLGTQRRSDPALLWLASNREGQRSQLYQVQEDGTDLVRRTRNRFEDSQPAVSPDGREVAFVSDRLGPRQIFRMSALEREAPARLLVGSPVLAHQPAWSPDGRRLAYTTYEKGFSHVFVLDLDSGLKEDLTPAGSHEHNPVWSPDGRWLALVTLGSQGACEISLVSPGGTLRRALTRAGGWNTAPSFSPDSRRIAFMSNRDGNPEIYTMALTGGQVERLTRDPAPDTDPRWSPDGKRIAFVSERNGGAQLFVMQADGTRVRPLLPKGEEAPRGYFERDACWVP